MKGTHGHTHFFLPSKPGARVTPALLDSHSVHRTSGALSSGPLPPPTDAGAPATPACLGLPPRLPLVVQIPLPNPQAPAPWSPSSPSPQPLQEVTAGLAFWRFSLSPPMAEVSGSPHTPLYVGKQWTVSVHAHVCKHLCLKERGFPSFLCATVLGERHRHRPRFIQPESG